MSRASAPEDSAPPIAVPHSRETCFGSATSYVLRRIALRAGALAPGIQDSIFYDLVTPRVGSSLSSTHAWLDGSGARLAAMGYRFGVRFTAVDATTLATWVFAGRGYRGAVMPTRQGVLFPDELATVGDNHAVGLAIEPVGGHDDLRMIDPWPEGGRSDRMEAPETLDAARRRHGQHALALYWVGWS